VDDPRPPDFRLPDDVRPTAYVLDLHVDPAAATVTGTVTIDVAVATHTPAIWLHAAPEIEVRSARVGDQAVRVVRHGDLLGLVGDRETGTARVAIDFSSPIDHERSRGIYAEREGDETYAYTFFEPIDARRAFPCFDEPGFKTPWTLVFHVKPEHVALGNAPIVSERAEGALKRVELAPTKPLPSYLVAFIVGPFELVDGGTGGRANTPIRFAIPKGRAGELGWAKQVTPRVVTALEDYFDMAYPFGKLDVAVVPRYWGTMEHPGIVAMGQPLTLIKPEQETRPRKQRYANILAHELAHYWFGDYVTTAWWNDTWLNEAFAEWLDAIITDTVEPSWRYRDDSVGAPSWAMMMDETLSTPPIRRPLTKPSEIEAAFDNSIVYYKGSAVIGMLEAWVGADNWRDTMRAYMAAHAWSNATADDVFAAIRDKLGSEAERTMRSFVEQPGVPLIAFEPRCERRALVLRQSRSLPPGQTDPKHPRWTLPVCFRYGDAKQAHDSCVVLEKAEAEVPLATCPTWFVPNRGGRGYYRSSIAPKLVRGLLDSRGALSRRAKPTLAEKVMAIIDLRAAAERSEIALTDVLALVPLVITDPDPRIAMWAQSTSGFRYDSTDDELWERSRSWFVKVFGPTARRLGWQRRPGDSDDLHRLRTTLVPWIARIDKTGPLGRDAEKLVDRWLRDRSGLPDDLVDGALDVAGYRGDTARFDAYLAAAKAPRDRTEQGRLLRALGSFTDPDLAKRALAIVLGTELDIRETTSIFYRVLGRRETRDLALDFLAAHITELLPRMREDTAGGFLESIAAEFCDQPRRDRVRALLAEPAKTVGGAELLVARALEKSDQCIAELAHQLPDLQRFLGMSR